MISQDAWSLSFPDLSYSWGKTPEKTSTRKTDPTEDWTWPAMWMARMLPLNHSGGASTDSIGCNAIFLKFVYCSYFCNSPKHISKSLKCTGTCRNVVLERGAMWCPWDLFILLRSIQMLKREWGVESSGKLHTYSSLVKLQPWFLSLRCKTCLWAELQPWCLNLLWKTCPWAEHSDDDD